VQREPGHRLEFEHEGVCVDGLLGEDMVGGGHRRRRARCRARMCRPHTASLALHDLPHDRVHKHVVRTFVCCTARRPVGCDRGRRGSGRLVPHEHEHRVQQRRGLLGWGLPRNVHTALREVRTQRRRIAGHGGAALIPLGWCCVFTGQLLSLLLLVVVVHRSVVVLLPGVASNLVRTMSHSGTTTRQNHAAFSVRPLDQSVTMWPAVVVCRPFFLLAWLRRSAFCSCPTTRVDVWTRQSFFLQAVSATAAFSPPPPFLCRFLFFWRDSHQLTLLLPSPPHHAA